MKVLKKMLISEKNLKEYTLNEKYILQHNENPYIVNLYYSFQDDENLYLILDFVKGGKQKKKYQKK